MNYLVFSFSLALLLIGSLYLGMDYSKGGSHHLFSSAKSIGLLPLCLTLLATQVGGGMLMGIAKEAEQAGVFAGFYSLGQAFGFLVLGLGAGARLRALNITTTAQLLSKRYRSRFLQKLTGFISILSLAGILIAMVIAMRDFLESVGLTESWISALIWLVLVTYTVVGGLRAVIRTDVLQIIFVLTILSLCLLVALSLQWESIQSFFKGYDWRVSYLSSKKKMMGWLINPFLFMFVEQDMAQRFFAGKSNKTTSRACLLAAFLLALIAFIPTFFGMLSAHYKLVSSNPLMQAILFTTNPFFGGLAGCAILAAIISTADSLLIAVSSNLYQDFGWRFSLRGTRFVTLLVGAIAFFGSYFSNNIFDMMIKSYALSIACLFVPVVVAIFDKKEVFAHIYAGWGSVVGGVSALFLAYIILPGSDGAASLLAIIGSFVGLLVGHLLKYWLPSASSLPGFDKKKEAKI